jgi:hypothetical protein
MTVDEFRTLTVGDRIRFEPDNAFGTVAEKKYGFAWIQWDDGVKRMVIGARSKDDRDRLKRLTKV